MGILTVLKNRNKVLGLNSRYLEYMRPYNKRRGIRIADNKIRTKKILLKAGLPVPKQILRIRNFEEVENLTVESLPSSFVIKPVHGIEGGGIDIFFNYKNGKWIRGDRSTATLEQIKLHLYEILEGSFSLYNQADEVLIEERIKPHSNFKQYTYKGATPDVRVIVFNGIPVMSMIRIPTKESKGKANLSLGAIGGAIDLASGSVISAIVGKKEEIEFVPHSHLRLAGLKIPNWDKILTYAVKAQNASGLGFTAVDFLIDRNEGPKIVEINARPGLSIQLADREGLRTRLDKLKDIKVIGNMHGIRISKNLFGGEIEESIEQITGKAVVSDLETVTLRGISGLSLQTKAKIDTGADSSSVDRRILEQIGYYEPLQRFDEFMSREFDEDYGMNISRDEAGRYAYNLALKLKTEDIQGIEDIYVVNSSHGRSYRPYLKVELSISGKTFETLCSCYDRSRLKYAVIIGKRSLSNFLIDVAKNNIE